MSSKLVTFGQQLQNMSKILRIQLQNAKFLTKFSCISEFGAIRKMHKFVNLVDFVKTFQTNEIAIHASIYLQKSASTQPRTGLSFAKN